MPPQLSDGIEFVFREHVRYYFLGLVSRSFFSTTVDKLLYSSFSQRNYSLDPKLFHALMSASALSSVFSREELHQLHSELQNFMGVSLAARQA